jgi:hypothetical protein
VKQASAHKARLLISCCDVVENLTRGQSKTGLQGQPQCQLKPRLDMQSRTLHEQRCLHTKHNQNTTDVAQRPCSTTMHAAAPTALHSNIQLPHKVAAPTTNLAITKCNSINCCSIKLRTHIAANRAALTSSHQTH